MLTDYYSKLTFVTLSLDGELKLWTEEGQLESTGLVGGQIVNGCVVPNRQDFFVVSAINEETDIYTCVVFRRQHLKKTIQIGTSAVLDLKMSSVGNTLIIPKDLK